MYMIYSTVRPTVKLTEKREYALPEEILLCKCNRNVYSIYLLNTPVIQTYFHYSVTKVGAPFALY